MSSQAIFGLSARRTHSSSRHYSINYKQVSLAFAIEIVVVATSLVGAWLMASKYGRTSTDYLLMMLAPVGYAMVEFSRVPLALATLTQRNHFMKVVAALAVLCAAGVTVKSMSMLGELMFRPRLEAVAEAKQWLEKINHDRASTSYAIKAADDLVTQRKLEREAAEQQLARVTAEMGKRPGQTCAPISGTDNGGGIMLFSDTIDNRALSLELLGARHLSTIHESSSPANFDQRRRDGTLPFSCSGSIPVANR